MNFEQAIEEVESLEFDARLNIASGIRLFLQIAQEQEAIRSLLSELKDQENLQSLVSRVLDLSQREIDLRYENPWDTPLAIYVWLISMKDFTLARIAAGAASLAPQCWWAMKVSSEGLSNEPFRSDSSTVEISHQGKASAPIAQVSSYRNVVSLPRFLPATNNRRLERPAGFESDTEKVEKYPIAA